MPKKSKQPRGANNVASDALLSRAVVLGCHSILLNAFRYLDKQLAVLRFELKRHKPPHDRGVLGLAAMLKPTIRNLAELRMAKEKYMQLFQPGMVKVFSTEVEAAFSALKDAQAVITNLQSSLTAAANEGGETARQAVLQAARTVASTLSEVRKHSSILESLLAREAVAIGGSSIVMPSSLLVKGKRTVVAVDFVAYGKTAKALENLSKSAAAVLLFNGGIKDHLQKSLTDIRVNPDTVPSIGTGDGGIFIFKSPRQAVDFALQVRKRATVLAGSADGDLTRKFRIGIATGEIAIHERRAPDGTLLGFDAGGMVIALSVRIQTACDPGEIIACRGTFSSMGDRSEKFTQDRVVVGKPTEDLKIKAHCSPAIRAISLPR